MVSSIYFIELYNVKNIFPHFEILCFFILLFFYLVFKATTWDDKQTLRNWQL